MNNKLTNKDDVRKLFSLQGSRPPDILIESICNFFNKIPNNYVVQSQKDIEFIYINHEDYKNYNIERDNDKKILINFGNLNDLNISSVTGLVAHLFALIDIGYHKMDNLNPNNWLKVDLYSDDVARSWGFKKEVDDLRKIRHQKLPPEIKYPNIVVKNSVLNKNFETDLYSVLNKYKIQSQNKNTKIWYVDRFSVFCDLHNLKEKQIENVYIFTNNYKIEDMIKVFLDRDS